jgi:hypothetical protein
VTFHAAGDHIEAHHATVFDANFTEFVPFSLVRSQQ